MFIINALFVGASGDIVSYHFDTDRAFFGNADQHHTGFYAAYGKRALDIVGASAGLVLFAPIILGSLAWVALDGGSPIYGHGRIGRNGQRFRCWKIRSMRTDADAALKSHLANNPGAAAEWAKYHKLKDDPRVTRFGRFIRRTSIDELPQFWNVLIGNMSLVGPRPITEEELSRFGEFGELRCSVRPGITGLWQVQARTGESYEERVELDARYVNELSFGLDVRLLLATLRVFSRPTGC